MDTIHVANEIIESQKVRSDLLKWKIIAIAALSTVGFGISTNFEKAELALCTIPFVMAYIDALCLHIVLRIKAIGQWHQTEKAKELENDNECVYMRSYEEFTQKVEGCGAFNLEKWTIFYSSLLVNLILALLPLADTFASTRPSLFVYKYPVVISGGLGLTLTIVLKCYVNFKIKRIKKLN